MPVKTEVCYQHLAQQICNLVGSGSVQLLLGCPDTRLRHPLLDRVSSPGYHAVACIGSADTISLLQNEHIRALCDLAIQSGQVQTIDRWQSNTRDIQSIAIAPLERPAGILGFFLLTAARTRAFYHGERLLLHHYLPQVAQNLENDLRSHVGAAHPEDDQSAHPSMVGAPLALAPRILAQAQRIPERTQQSTQINWQRTELDRLKNEFISMVSHELRTPLTAIKGYSVLLQAYGHNASEDGSGEQMTALRQQEYLDIIMEQANHLEVLIGDLLDISRLHAGRLHLRFSYINVPQLCQRVIQLIQQRVDLQHPGQYKFSCMVAPEFPLVWADADRVQQILTNLLENAVKYSPHGGLIEIVASPCASSVLPKCSEALLETGVKADAADMSHIALTQEPSMVYISVRDQGIGVSLEQQTQLFKPFSRLEHALTIDVPGAGLGLYITRKLVEAMAGTVTLCSSEGTGTSVTFTLPIKAHKQ